MITDEQIVRVGAKALRLAEDAATAHIAGDAAGPGQWSRYAAGLAPAIFTLLVARGVD